MFMYVWNQEGFSESHILPGSTKHCITGCAWAYKRFEKNVRTVYTRILVFLIGIIGYSYDNAFAWMPQDLTDFKSMMTWYREARFRYMALDILTLIVLNLESTQYKRNTAWLRDTARQTSLGKSAAGALTSRGTSASPYRVTTQYPLNPVQIYKLTQQ